MENKSVDIVNPLIAWLIEAPKIEGSMWLKNSKNEKETFLCIPVNDKTRVIQLSDPVETYALIAKHSIFTEIMGVRSIVSPTKEQVCKYDWEKAKAMCDQYDVYYIPGKVVDVA